MRGKLHKGCRAMLGESRSSALQSMAHIPANWFDVRGIDILPLPVSNAHAPLPIMRPSVIDAAFRDTGYSQPPPALT